MRQEEKWDKSITSQGKINCQNTGASVCLKISRHGKEADLVTEQAQKKTVEDEIKEVMMPWAQLWVSVSTIQKKRGAIRESGQKNNMSSSVFTLTDQGYYMENLCKQKKRALSGSCSSNAVRTCCSTMRVFHSGGRRDKVNLTPVWK